MYWPTPQDYNEAVQTPQSSFADPELQAGCLELNHLGLPRPISGSFASVYRMECRSRQVAVRFFLRHFDDQQKRYLEVSDFVSGDDLPYTVSFEFVERGVRIRGAWYPLLKMEWVEGESLTSFTERNLLNPGSIARLCGAFDKMVVALRDNGIAHGDLQHGNIMVVGDELRLVDYDGMFVPALSGLMSNELGHRNYQHPGRTQAHFAPYLDNFSAWSIRTSLACLSLDPLLWGQLQAGDECLLFRQSDYKLPLQSTAFALLESHCSEEIRQATRQLRSLLGLDLEQIPFLDEPFQIPDHLLPLEQKSSIPSWLSSWLDDDASEHPEDGCQSINIPDAGQFAQSAESQRLPSGLHPASSPITQTKTLSQIKLTAQGQPAATAQMSPLTSGNTPGISQNTASLTTAIKPTQKGSAGQEFSSGVSYLAAVLALVLALFLYIAPHIVPPWHPRPAPVPSDQTTASKQTGKETATTLYRQAKQYYKQAKYAEAASCYEQVLARLDDSNLSESTGAGDCCQFLGRAYYMLDNPGRATPYFLRALRIFEKRQGPKGKAVMQLLHDIGVNAIANKDPKEAAAYFHEELATRLSCHDDKAGFAALKLEETAIALLKQGDPKAETYFKEAFSVLSRQAGKAELCLRDLRLSAWHLADKSANLPAADRVCRLAVALAGAHPGQHNTSLIECLEAYARNLTLQGRYAEADQVQARLKQLETRTL